MKTIIGSAINGDESALRKIDFQIFPMDPVARDAVTGMHRRSPMTSEGAGKWSLLRRRTRRIES